jgi:hypothetical protein
MAESTSVTATNAFASLPKVVRLLDFGRRSPPLRWPGCRGEGVSR